MILTDPPDARLDPAAGRGVISDGPAATGFVVDRWHSEAHGLIR